MPGGIAGLAAAMVQTNRFSAPSRDCAERSRFLVWPRRRAGVAAVAAAALAVLVSAGPAFAESNKVRITNLSDVAFGTVANLGTDAVRSQSLCLFADTPTNRYTITATGSGGGGAFDLSSGVRTMPFDVAWNEAPGQSSGTQLSPNVPLTGQVSAANQQTCNNGPANSASLVVVLRSAALSGATAGDYSGMLTLIVGAE